ncbi:MAG: SBBP repeat-containing protein [Candidatus Heimdallarchaeota archaeon]|nr:SBBP repeat-containing protein [Candidatus Heimdallarchaeota archaeon]
MVKSSQLKLNSLGIVLLVSIIGFSIPQQKFSFVSTHTVTYSESLPAIYPKLNYSTFLGGEDGGENGRGIAVTADGCYYVTGQTKSSDYPTQNAYDNTLNGSNDAVVTKFASNNSLIWSTYLGGGGQVDIAQDIAVATDGSCYITGRTTSSDFPTKNAFDDTFNGGYTDAFVTKFAVNGSLLWSTYLGGGGDLDVGHSIAVATDGSCYVTGETTSSDFPTLNAYESTYNGGNFDIFFTKFASNGTLLWSSYFGGSRIDVGYGIAVTSDGSFYITGFTTSPDFPTQNAYDTTQNGDWDVYLSKFDKNCSLLWSTYLGGIYWDEAWGVAATSDGSCYVTGYTDSPDFPTQYGFNNTYGMGGDAFLTKFASNGSLLWSSFLGGSSGERGYDVAATSDGSCYVAGYTASENFPTLNAYDDSKAHGYDAFVMKFSSTGSLFWSTYLGGNSTDEGYGIATAENGSCYIIGKTWSADFPTFNPYDNTTSDYGDMFIVKFVDSPLPSTPSTHTHTIDGFLVFIAVMPLIAFIPVIILIFSKKRK